MDVNVLYAQLAGISTLDDARRVRRQLLEVHVHDDASDGWALEVLHSAVEADDSSLVAALRAHLDDPAVRCVY